MKKTLDGIFVGLVWVAYLASLFYLSMAVLAIFIGTTWPTWFIVAVSLSGIYIAYVIYVLVFYKRKKIMKKSHR